MLKFQPFDRSKHVYKNDAFVELVKDAVRFFNGTPVSQIPPPEKFEGRGVYALYYTGKYKIYAKYGEINRLSYDYPIYVGKAVPSGWRHSRIADSSTTRSYELHRRLIEHSRSIIQVKGPSINDFACRFVILDDAASDMIGSIEAALIKLNRPLWNSALDGFGNHTPGAGRFAQARSDWDVIHPGRPWSARCSGIANPRKQILGNICHHLTTLTSR